MILYKEDGQHVSGRIIRIGNSLREIEQAELKYALKRFQKTIIHLDDIETILPMGRRGKAQITRLSTDIQSIKIKNALVPHGVRRVVLITTIAAIGTIIGLGLLFLRNISIPS